MQTEITSGTINKWDAANIVYTKLGASGSNYSRVTFDSTTSEVQHRMPSVRIHGTLGATVKAYYIFYCLVD